MEDKKQSNKGDEAPMTGKTHGPQGIDKAPGEEPAEDLVQFSQDTQKGKKVDADPDQETDKPASQEELP